MMKYINNNRLISALLLSSGSAIILLIFRVIFASRLTYVFLLWNLFLAWLPLFFAIYLEKTNSNNKISFKIVLLFSMWLLFFPNSPYIITDLIHLKERHTIPLWFDIILIVSFAWTALMIGFISLLKIQVFIEKRLDQKISWIIIISMLIISSFGVYLGRFLRWNSWDIITNPFELFSDIGNMVIHPLSHPQTLGVTIIFSFFLVTGYTTVYFIHNEKSSLS